tara:strand:+ start:1114 stop:1326 length:213 start_codon:yes stop_codon:yes gene_type:complete
MNEKDAALRLFNGDLSDEDYRAYLANDELDSDLVLEEYEKLEIRKTVRVGVVCLISLALIATACFIILMV